MQPPFLRVCNLFICLTFASKYKHTARTFCTSFGAILLHPPGKGDIPSFLYDHPTTVPLSPQCDILLINSLLSNPGIGRRASVTSEYRCERRICADQVLPNPGGTLHEEHSRGTTTFFPFFLRLPTSLIGGNIVHGYTLATRALFGTATTMASLLSHYFSCQSSLCLRGPAFPSAPSRTLAWAAVSKRTNEAVSRPIKNRCMCSKQLPQGRAALWSPWWAVPLPWWRGTLPGSARRPARRPTWQTFADCWSTCLAYCRSQLQPRLLQNRGNNNTFKFNNAQHV